VEPIVVCLLGFEQKVAAIQDGMIRLPRW
jgi:hypothetical protein